ncbi:MAG: class I SAM-dependent methyltransferase [Azonexus sp.]|jgi:SAM-dependent methyltransferase|nr:class I SAM-dependent methyltransferase [Azonexus sp.]
MIETRLDKEAVLSGYDKVCALYPYVPSLSHWRAWECAAYEKFQMSGRILDVGCGDGRYFNLLWPGCDDVVGVDMDPVTAQLAVTSGIYRNVHTTAAHEIPEESASFDHVFANCSLEHMDRLDTVLAEISRCLRPGGTLLCSVVTNRFNEWSALPTLLAAAGYQSEAGQIQAEFETFHHLANPLRVLEWTECFLRAGLQPLEHIPILPKNNSGAFLLMDVVWHVKKAGGGELGDIIFPFLSSNPRFPAAFRSILAGLIDMEEDWRDCSGAVFLVQKSG